MVKEETRKLFRKLVSQLEAAGENYVLVMGDENGGIHRSRGTALLTGWLTGQYFIKTYKQIKEQGGSEYAAQFKKGFEAGGKLLMLEVE